MKEKGTRPQVHRMDRRIVEHVHDPYMTRLKPTDPSLCPNCGVAFHQGRWQWPTLPLPADTHREICPACRRIHDKYPAGWLTISGGFFKNHKDEILHLARHQEEQEKGEHPMHRIMDIEDTDDGVVVTTTDIHLPRRIGEALHHAYQGELDFHYAEEDYHLRVRWIRDA